MAGIDALLSELDYPMFIVTTAAGGERGGCLVGFGSQVTIDSSRFLVCLSDKNRTCRIARGATHLAVHFVPADREDLAELFGGETGDEVDKLAQTDWHEGLEGMPLIDGCANRFVGRILERYVFGDHVGYLLDPVTVDHGTEGAEFTFHRAKRIEPGHAA